MDDFFCDYVIPVLLTVLVGSMAIMSFAVAWAVVSSTFLGACP